MAVESLVQNWIIPCCFTSCVTALPTIPQLVLSNSKIIIGNILWFLIGLSFLEDSAMGLSLIIYLFSTRRMHPILILSGVGRYRRRAHQCSSPCRGATPPDAEMLISCSSWWCLLPPCLLSSIILWWSWYLILMNLLITHRLVWCWWWPCCSWQSLCSSSWFLITDHEWHTCMETTLIQPPLALASHKPPFHNNGKTTQDPGLIHQQNDREMVI